MELKESEEPTGSTWSKIKRFLTSCIPELTLALLNISVTMVTTAALPQILRGTCYYQHGPAAPLCHHPIIQVTSEEDNLQSMAAYYTSIFRLLISIPPLFAALYCGTSSDRIGKKLPILLTLTGIILSQFIFILSDFFRSYTLALILGGGLLMGVSGNVETVGVCLLAHTSNNTTVNLRTFKIGLLTGASFLGKFLGAILTGAALRLYSYQETYMIATIMTSLSFFICLAFLEDIDSDSGSETDTVNISERRFLIAEKSDTNGCSSISDMCNFMCKKRSTETRLCLTCVVIASFLATMTHTGTWDILNLIIKRPELAMDDATYGFVRATGAASNALVLLAFQGILSQMCGISDITMCIVSPLASVARYTLLGVTESSWAIWASSGIQGLGVMLNSASISLASKQIAPEEQGKLMALLQVPQFLGNAIGTLVYASIYAATILSFPRLVFFVAAGTQGLLLILFGAIVLWKYRKR